jgi:hypothetical protein
VSFAEREWLYMDGSRMATLLEDTQSESGEYKDAHSTKRDDIMMWLSTSWGDAAHRKADNSGSYFVEAIDKVLRAKDFKYEDINSLFREVRV